MEDRTQYRDPDWAAPLDVAAHLDATPASATAKGMFFAVVVDEYKERGLSPPTRERYVSFKDYPIRDWIELGVQAAGDLYPERPLREGLRRLGQRAYPTLTESFIGRVVFGVLGNHIESIMRIAPKGYELSLTGARARVVEASAGHGVVHLAGVYNFLDAYHVGVFEGTLRACNRSGRVRVRPVSLSEAFLLTEWW